MFSSTEFKGRIFLFQSLWAFVAIIAVEVGQTAGQTNCKLRAEKMQLELAIIYPNQPFLYNAAKKYSYIFYCCISDSSLKSIPAYAMVCHSYSMDKKMDPFW